MTIIEAGDLPEQEKIYLKKDVFGYRIVNPIYNEDGSVNWVNLLFGGMRNLIFLLCILAILGFLVWSHYHDVAAIQSNYQMIASDPLKWCKEVCREPTKQWFKNYNFTFIE